MLVVTPLTPAAAKRSVAPPSLPLTPAATKRIVLNMLKYGCSQMGFVWGGWIVGINMVVLARVL